MAFAAMTKVVAFLVAVLAMISTGVQASPGAPVQQLWTYRDCIHKEKSSCKFWGTDKPEPPTIVALPSCRPYGDAEFPQSVLTVSCNDTHTQEYLSWGVNCGSTDQGHLGSYQLGVWQEDYPVGSHGDYYYKLTICSYDGAPTSAPTPPPSPLPPSPCNFGDVAKCPGGSIYQPEFCSGDQCCQDGSTCPSAHESFNSCPKPKSFDCLRHPPLESLTGEAKDFVGSNFEQSTYSGNTDDPIHNVTMNMV